MLVGFIYDRRHTRKIYDFGGIKSRMPLYAGIFLFTSFSSIGLPGLNGFVGEFKILMGSFEVFKVLSIISAFGVVLAAIYMLWAYQRMFTGTIENEENNTLLDLNYREIISVMPLVILMLLIGIFPGNLENLVSEESEYLSELIFYFVGGK